MVIGSNPAVGLNFFQFDGNQYSKKENAAKNIGLDRENAREGREESEDQVESSKQNNVRPLSASVQKLKKQNSDSSEDYTCEEENDSGGLKGFRFIGISVLASVFESQRCPLCKQRHVVLKEDEKAKMGKSGKHSSL